MKEYYVHYEDGRNPHNKFEGFVSKLMQMMDKDIVNEQKMNNDVEMFKSVVNKEHEGKYKRCGEVSISFYDFGGKCFLSTEVGRVFYYPIERKER